MKNKSNNENRTFKSVKIGDTLKNFNQDFLHKFGKLDYTIFSKFNFLKRQHHQSNDF